MASCVAPDGNESLGLAESTCGCLYDHFEENVEFDVFADAARDRREDPTVLEGSVFDEAYSACGVAVGGGDAEDQGGATTTTEAGVTTTTEG